MKKGLLKFGFIGIFTLLVSSILAQPSVTDYDPSSGATDVSVDKTLTLTFDENLKVNPNSNYNFPNTPPRLKIFNSQDELIEQYLAAGGNFYDVNYEVVENIYITDENLIVNPSNSFLTNTDYHIIIDEGLVYAANDDDNSHPFPGFSDSETWHFTTTVGAPSWISDYPTITSQTTSYAYLDLQMNQDGNYYYVVTNSLSAPTESQIEAGQNENGNLAELDGSGTLTANTVADPDIDISGLPAGIHFLHVVASNGSDYTSIESFNIDLDAPDLNSFSPEDGAVNKPVNSNVVLNFNEKIYTANVGEITNSNIETYIKILEGTTETNYTATFSNENKTITLDPDADLNHSTTYTISFHQKFTDKHGNQQSTLISQKTFTTKEPDTHVWTGSSSTWGDASNWDEGTIPPDGNNVYIQAGQGADPEITTETVSLNNLTIEAGASLIQNGGSLSVNGTFTLESTTENNASYLPLGGTPPSSIKAKQRISNDPSIASDNYFVASPVTGATKGDAGLTSASEAIVYYQNPTNSYVHLENDADEITNGRGHVVLSDEDLTFIGSPVTSEKTIDVVRNADGGLGWNLVGNPFTAGMDWSKITLNDVDNSYWLWLNESGIYGTYNGFTGISTVIDLEESNGIIPSNHSFWIRVTEGDADGEGSLVIPTDAMTVNKESFLKSTSSTKYPSLKLASSIDGKKDELAVSLVPEASSSIDKFDSQKKVSGNNDLVEVYSLINSEEMAINGLPLDQQQLEIPVGYYTESTGNCKFSLALNTLSDDLSVMLYDQSNSQYTELTNGVSYEFDVAAEGAVNDRFSLVISKSTATSIEKEENKIEKPRFYSNESEIIAYIPELKDPRYKLIDINGRLHKSGNLQSESRNTVTVNKKGVFILVVESATEKVKTFKTVF